MGDLGDDRHLGPALGAEQRLRTPARAAPPASPSTMPCAPPAGSCAAAAGDEGLGGGRPALACGSAGRCSSRAWVERAAQEAARPPPAPMGGRIGGSAQRPARPLDRARPPHRSRAAPAATGPSGTVISGSGGAGALAQSGSGAGSRPKPTLRPCRPRAWRSARWRCATRRVRPRSPPPARSVGEAVPDEIVPAVRAAARCVPSKPAT